MNLSILIYGYESMWRDEVGCSLRSRELNLFQIENFQGHEHAGVAHWADVQRFIDKLE